MLKQILALVWLAPALGSRGDMSKIFLRCLNYCRDENCHSRTDFEAHQPSYLKWFLWDCHSECQYSCMWLTVSAFQKDRLMVPQFYGKWPFSRLFGVQEPASALFSLINALPHLYMLFQFNFVRCRNSMLFAWHIYAMVAVFTWFWATVFHCRDTHFTEKMDYFCACFLNLAGIMMLCLRLLIPGKHFHLAYSMISVLISFFVYHVYHLSIHFDYGYNMKVNVLVMFSYGFSWICWCVWNLKRQPYVRDALLSLILLGVTSLLELIDFAPYFWILDAHALWHALTPPLSVLWYRFVIADLHYLEKPCLSNGKKLK